MATYEFKLPDIGEGVVEGEIVKWLVKEGDAIAEDQPLVEVMTDKATVTIPSPKKGIVLKTHGGEGEIAKVHGTLVTLEVDGAGVPRTAPTPRAASNGSATAKILATPVTRRMAREHGLSLESISGSGPQGRVTKADVEAAIGGGALAAAKPAMAKPQPPKLVTTTADQRIPLKGLRRKIAENMVRSKFTAPHFTFVEEMDATALANMRARLNEALAQRGDSLRLSFLPFVCKALVEALRQFPHLNANFDEAAQELIVRGEYNFGIAAATPEGLVVPVLKHADRLSLRELAHEISRLGNAARDKRLKLEELSGGTFTITSLGQKAGLFATPIINHPEVAVLGVHKMRKRPVVDQNGQIMVREMMYLSLSFDHRSIDGAVGADFTYALIHYLENPELLFLEHV
ncbi:MAG: dihydrolipoamide acetyltransferase family protein [Myxococcota bacterium]